ncbi:hypothetical protein HMPREF1583_01192 [Gardnerella vaginalis JCP8151B]|nr:hypothetical protein HMPREF1583_01192 [Gardnerella vaginalis JCP8151B]
MSKTFAWFLISEILDFSCSLSESPSGDAEARFDSCEKSRISTSLALKHVSVKNLVSVKSSV